MTRALPVRLLRSVYVWTASLLFAITLLGWRPIGHVIYQAPGWLSPFLYATQAVGLALIVSAARIIDALELAGIRSANGHMDSPSAVRTGWSAIRSISDGCWWSGDRR